MGINTCFLKIPLLSGKSRACTRKCAPSGSGKHDRGSITAHDPANTRRDGSQQFLKIQVRDDLVGEIKDELQPILRLPRQVEVHGSIDG